MWGCGSPSPHALKCIEQLQGTDEVGRGKAAAGLSTMRPGDRSTVFAALARLLESKVWEERAKAAQALAEIGRQTRAGRDREENQGADDDGWAEVESHLAAMAPGVARLLKDPTAQVRLIAATALVRMPIEDKSEAVWELSELFLNGLGTIRYRAGDALREAGPEARAIVPRVRYFLCSAKDDPQVCRQAAELLETVGSEGKAEGIAHLRAVLRDPESDYRAEAAVTLGLIGPDARAAVPELTACLQSNDAKTRAEAARALKRVGTSDQR